MIGGLHARVVSSDRYFLRILDRNISYQDIHFQLRNLKALSCIYDDALVIQYFGKNLSSDLEQFLAKVPEQDSAVRIYLQGQEVILRKIRFFFKILRYSEDQKTEVSHKLSNLIRESSSTNGCNGEVLYKDGLKTNFRALMEMELYLRARYGAQLKNNQNFDSIRSSIELFVESLDKQFGHEYYW